MSFDELFGTRRGDFKGRPSAVLDPKPDTPGVSDRGMPASARRTPRARVKAAPAASSVSRSRAKRTVVKPAAARPAASSPAVAAPAASVPVAVAPASVPAAKPATRRRWSEDTVRAALEQLCAGKTQFPSRREFTDAGLFGLFVYLMRAGTLEHWATEFGLALPTSAQRAANRWSGGSAQ